MHACAILRKIAFDWQAWRSWRLRNSLTRMIEDPLTALQRVHEALDRMVSPRLVFHRSDSTALLPDQRDARCVSRQSISTRLQGEYRRGGAAAESESRGQGKPPYVLIDAILGMDKTRNYLRSCLLSCLDSPVVIVP